MIDDGEDIDETAQQAAIEQREQDRRTQEQLELAGLLEIYEFRHFIWRLLGTSGFYDASFTGEALTTAFREGKRHVGQMVHLDILTVDPDIETLMRREHLARKTSTGK